jgi:hypothetical protein
VRGAAALALAGACALAVPPVVAQTPCDGRPIRQIRITTLDVYEDGGGGRTPTWVVGAARALSWRTRPSAVRADLLFRAGDRCDQVLLDESERLLRNRLNLRAATVAATPGGGDSLDIEVRTLDDWTLGAQVVLDLDAEHQLRHIMVTQSNLVGTGTVGRLVYDARARDPGLTVELSNPHLPGRTYGEFAAGRSSTGPVFRSSLARPFDVETAQRAWQVAFQYLENPFDLRSEEFGPVVLPYAWNYLHVGAAWRWGRPEHFQWFLGFSALESRMAVMDPPQATDPGQDSAAAAAMAGRFTDVRRVALGARGGVRRIRFDQRMGVDAVHAVEDVRLGAEAEVASSRSLGIAGEDLDWLLLGSVYAGAEIGPAFVAVRARAEGRIAKPNTRWNNVVAAGDVLAYVPIGRRGTFAGALQAAGGWHMSVPFQVALDGQHGMRAQAAPLPVGQRLVARGEYRHYSGTLTGIADVGWAAFAEAGRGWAGDAIFGTTTGLLISTGAGLRLALPPGSQFVARLDLATAVQGRGGVELRFAIKQQFGVGQGEPNDVARSRQPLAVLPPFNDIDY